MIRMKIYCKICGRVKIVDVCPHIWGYWENCPYVWVCDDCEKEQEDEEY